MLPMPLGFPFHGIWCCEFLFGVHYSSKLSSVFVLNHPSSGQARQCTLQLQSSAIVQFCFQFVGDNHFLIFMLDDFDEWTDGNTIWCFIAKCSKQ